MGRREEYSPYEKRLRRHYRLRSMTKHNLHMATLFRFFHPKRTFFSDPPPEKQATQPVLLEDPRWKHFQYGICPDTDSCPWYTTFIDFCEENTLPYKVFNIHESGWLEEALSCDFIFWRPSNAQHSVREALYKIMLLHNEGVRTFPPLHDLALYENKSLQYALLDEKGLPAAPTFVSHDYEEVLGFIQKRTRWPLVSKIKTGSASVGVRLLKNKREALDFTRKIFTTGIRYFWHGNRQKDYVFFQDYIEGQAYDLRIITAGDRLFGYYRYPKKHDFRASGSGRWEFKELPEDALNMALAVREALGLTDAAVDFLRDSEGHLHIIEVSLFTYISSPAQAIVGGVPGYYRRSSDKSFLFKQALVWPQHLMLHHFLTQLDITFP